MAAGELLNYPYLGRAIFSRAALGDVVAGEKRILSSTSSTDIRPIAGRNALSPSSEIGG
jgi:hypothetical protein